MKMDVEGSEYLILQDAFDRMGCPPIDQLAIEFHHFSDASETGYGQCSYIRLMNDRQEVYCSLVMAKARVTPLKMVTIPRLELMAALVSVRVSQFLEEELKYEAAKHVFWTDSRVVLGYITNDSTRFHTYVANRVQQIRDATSPDQWHYVKSADNPADQASRGVSAQELTQQSTWFSGPTFLRKEPVTTDDTNLKIEIEPEDPEVKRVKVLATHSRDDYEDFEFERFDRINSWHQLKVVVAVCLSYMSHIKSKINDDPTLVEPLEVNLLQKAEVQIIKMLQKKIYKEELSILKDGTDTKNTENGQRRKVLRRSSTLYRLDPFIDSEGVIRVGGRITNAEIPYHLRHPAVLPRNHRITELVIEHFHQKNMHQGRRATVHEIRSNGLWIVGCSTAVASITSRCVGCRKLRGNLQTQKMANLPNDRVNDAPPFAYCAVDVFGPWIIKQGRSEVKRYGVIFVCMASLAIHLETVNSMDTSSFINALRRFVSLRGPVREIRCDRGTNFVGAANEFRNVRTQNVGQFLRSHGCDFKFNVPSASHMAGSWERLIRSVRNVLTPMLSQQGQQLDDEGLRTLLCEVTAIVNCRPLTAEDSNDIKSCIPITPHQLLTMKTEVVLPPPGEFTTPDLYARKHWRRVQHLANYFWTRWRKEYLLSLQERAKWRETDRNSTIGDLVLIKDENLPRMEWRLGRIIDTIPSEDGLVRKVKVKIGDKSSDQTPKAPVILERPIHKLVLVMPGRPGTPDQEPTTGRPGTPDEEPIP